MALRTLLEWFEFRRQDVPLETLRAHAANLQRECQYRDIECVAIPSPDPRFESLVAYPTWLLRAYFTAVPPQTPSRYVYPPGSGPCALPESVDTAVLGT